MNAAELFIRCLENEGVTEIFGIPGEENLAVMDALLSSPIRFITTRHEQGAAFMADVYGRLTGKAGVCLATLGPGATNLVTGFADANMDRAPIIGIAGQGATTRLHKESHQILHLVNLFALTVAGGTGAARSWAGRSRSGAGPSRAAWSHGRSTARTGPGRATADRGGCD